MRHWAFPGPGRSRRDAASLHLSPQDVRELAELEQQVTAEFGGTAPEVLEATLRQLRARGVPLRKVRGTRAGQAALSFADGTVIEVLGLRVGDIMTLATSSRQCPAQCGHWRRVEGHVDLDVHWSGHTRTVRVMGLGS